MAAVFPSLLGGQKLLVQPGKLVTLARSDPRNVLTKQKTWISFCGLCLWQPMALPSLAAVTTGAFPSGKKAKVRVAQDLISMGFKVTLW